VLVFIRLRSDVLLCGVDGCQGCPGRQERCEVQEGLLDLRLGVHIRNSIPTMCKKAQATGSVPSVLFVVCNMLRVRRRLMFDKREGRIYNVLKALEFWEVGRGDVARRPRERRHVCMVLQADGL
jgi:hypothetical protein